jgi:inner membrane protein
MPSPIGHALAGVAVAWAIDPRTDRRLTLAAASLAALPDIDLLLPIQHRTITHSLGAVIAVTIIAAVVTAQVTRRSVARVALICAAAYASHLLLDWLGVDDYFPYGLTLLWPFSDRFYISGWNLFPETARQHLFTGPSLVVNLKAIAQEVALLGPIVLAVWLERAAKCRKRPTTEDTVDTEVQS